MVMVYLFGVSLVLPDRKTYWRELKMKVKITVIESGVVDYATDDPVLAARWAAEDFEQANVLMTDDGINDYDCEITYEPV
jgi:hypothetical protein